MIKELYDSLFEDAHIHNLSVDPLYLDKTACAYRQDPTAFSEEYRRAVNLVIREWNGNVCSETVQAALKMARLMEVNIFLMLDNQMLSESLSALSNMLQALDTVFANEKYEDTFGMVVDYQVSLHTMKLLERAGKDSNEQTDPLRNFIIKAVSQVPVTNTTLAIWNGSTLAYYGLRVEKKVRQALKALYLYDRLLGSGILDLLLKNTQEKVEKKLKAFDDVGMRWLTEDILGFYACRTGNEKKRFLANIENTVGNADITAHVNAFLTEAK